MTHHCLQQNQSVGHVTNTKWTYFSEQLLLSVLVIKWTKCWVFQVGGFPHAGWKHLDQTSQHVTALSVWEDNPLCAPLDFITVVLEDQIFTSDKLSFKATGCLFLQEFHWSHTASLWRWRPRCPTPTSVHTRQGDSNQAGNNTTFLLVEFITHLVTSQIGPRALWGPWATCWKPQL